MPYAQGRVYHDADSHLMEPADWLVPFAEGADEGPPAPGAIPPSTRPPVTAPKEKVIEGLIAGPKGWLAYGACDPAERTRALDELGFSSQLVFPTSSLAPVPHLLGPRRRLWRRPAPPTGHGGLLRGTTA